MLLDQTTLSTLAIHFSSYALILGLIVPALGGEMGVLFLAFLSGQGVFPLWEIITGSFLGMLALDVFWFFLPRSPWAMKMKERLRVSEKYRRLESRLESVSHHNDIIVLFLSKVLVGTRILVLAYLSVRNISFRKFLMYDAIATFFWAICLGIIGWFAGLGFYNLSQTYHNITTFLIFIAFVVALFYGIVWFIRTWIEKK